MQHSLHLKNLDDFKVSIEKVKKRLSHFIFQKNIAKRFTEQNPVDLRRIFKSKLPKSRI